MDEDSLLDVETFRSGSWIVGHVPPQGRQSSEHEMKAESIGTADSNAKSLKKSKRPSCNLCRRRKIKCDRLEPCSHCVRSSAKCVFSPLSGAPRGRQGGRRRLDRELLDRVAKLESLLKNAQGESKPKTSDTSASTRDNSGSPAKLDSPASSSKQSSTKASEEGFGQYLGANVWMSLSDAGNWEESKLTNQIHGVREVLDQSSDEEDSTNRPASQGKTAQNLASNFVVGLAASNTAAGLEHPSRSHLLFLFSAFMLSVDPLVKLLHGPSLRRYLLDGAAELECSPGSQGWDALRFAIYYTATTTLEPEDCLENLGEEKSVLLARYRSGVEAALALADFVNSEDMSTLQALVLYLFGVRSNENTRRTWTLTSLAVRIAQALGLHREDKGNTHFRPFEREMRRRLWWQICLIDRQGSFDRGSDPIITVRSFNTPLPLNVNDEDLIPGSQEEPRILEDYTDMTLGLVCHELFDTERRLNFVPPGDFDKPQGSPEIPWSQKRDWVIECQKRIDDKYLRHCCTSILVQRYTIFIGDIMLAIMWLCTVRPVQKRWDMNSFEVPGPEILRISVEIMEKAIKFSMDESVKPFIWISRIWVQWHALAIMLAELCVQVEGPVVERAWSIVNVAYKEVSKLISDSEKGRLFRPIKKLMQKATMVREMHLDKYKTVQASQKLDESVQTRNQTDSAPSSEPIAATTIALGAGPHLAADSQTVANNSDLDMINWDASLLPDTWNGMDYNSMNEMSWSNWESFVEDFQASADPQLDSDTAMFNSVVM